MKTEDLIQKYLQNEENPYQAFEDRHFKLKIKNAMAGDLVSLNGNRWDTIKTVRRTPEVDPVHKNPVYYIEFGSGKSLRRAGNVVVDAFEV